MRKTNIIYFPHLCVLDFILTHINMYSLMRVEVTLSNASRRGMVEESRGLWGIGRNVFKIHHILILKWPYVAQYNKE